jgi:hypothetical protein
MQIRVRATAVGAPGLPLQHRRGVLGVIELSRGGGLLQGSQAQEVGCRRHDRSLATQVDDLIRPGIQAGCAGLGGHPAASCRDRRGPVTYPGRLPGSSASRRRQRRPCVVMKPHDPKRDTACVHSNISAGNEFLGAKLGAKLGANITGRLPTACYVQPQLSQVVTMSGDVRPCLTTATSARRSPIAAACSSSTRACPAITASRVAHDAQPGAGGGRTVITAHHHRRPSVINTTCQAGSRRSACGVPGARPQHCRQVPGNVLIRHATASGDTMRARRWRAPLGPRAGQSPPPRSSTRPLVMTVSSGPGADHGVTTETSCLTCLPGPT